MTTDNDRPDAAEMDYWEGMLSNMNREKRKATLPATVGVFFLLNLTAFLMTDQYAVVWILSSLLFCVFSVLFLIMPTTRPSKVREPAERKLRLDKANVIENKELLGLAMWNGFFMNSQPMAFGVVAIFSFDISLILYLGIIGQVLTAEVTGLLLLQSAGIILFYIGIVRIKPYDVGFLEEVWSIGRSVKDVLKGRSVRRFRNVFLTVLVLSVFVASLVIAMLLPGSSIKMLRGDSNVDLAKVMAPIVLIFLSQFILVRVTQGLSSRRMAEDMLRRKLSLLRSRHDVRGTGIEDLDEHMPMYFKVVRHDILGFFPVYMMSPDLAAILGEKGTQ